MGNHVKLSDDIRRIVHAFGDKGRKDEIRRMAKVAERYEDFIVELASEPYAYGDGCPDFGTKHGRCLHCKARAALHS